MLVKHTYKFLPFFVLITFPFSTCDSWAHIWNEIITKQGQHKEGRGKRFW